VGLQAELIITTAILVGAALLFGGFILLRLTEQRLIEQQLKHVQSTVQLVKRSLSSNLQPDKKLDSEQIDHLLSNLDLELQGWQLYNQSMRAVGGELFSVKNNATHLVRQARLSTGLQLQIDYPANWLSFIDHSTGSISAATALHDNDHRFAGVVWFQFSMANVHDQVAATRRMVFLYVLLYGLVLTTFGVVVLNRNVVRPVNRLNDATATIAAGDLETQVTITGPREIADLGLSFNRMTEALRHGRNELLRSERMASVGHLSAGMAHEIGNPLAAIIGYLEMLKVDIRDEGQRDLVERSLAEAARIDQLVRDLLDYAAPTGVIADPIDPCAVIDATINSLQSQNVFEGYSICMECPEGLPEVCINPHKLTQVLVNLISNARDASEIGSTIIVSAIQDEAAILISIRDQGSGIDDQTRKQIFDPFFSTKPEGQGRGLGLTICHRIVEEAGGRIDVSVESTGTVFIVRLPIFTKNKDLGF
jgi:signal transduction histidine kinase